MMLLAAADLADGNALVIIAGAAATALTTLTGVLVSQVSGLRSDLKAIETKHDNKLDDLTERVEQIEDRIEDCPEADTAPPRGRKKITGSHSTSRGRAPRDNIRDSDVRTPRRPRTQPGDIR